MSADDAKDDKEDTGDGGGDEEDDEPGHPEPPGNRDQFCPCCKIYRMSSQSGNMKVSRKTFGRLSILQV